jgi:hypothetical protein
MTWYAWVLVAYIVVDLCAVAWIGRSIEMTPAVAVVSLVSGGLLVWAVVSLAAS